MMAKKWKLPFHDLKEWAAGRTIYVQNYSTLGYYYAPVAIERLLRVIENGRAIEFIANEDVGDIARKCLEELALTDESYDYEYEIQYYTEQGLKNNEIEL